MLEAFEEYRHYPEPSSALRESEADTKAALTEYFGALAFRVQQALGSVRFRFLGAMLEMPTPSEVREISLKPRMQMKLRQDVFLNYSRLAVPPLYRGQKIGDAMIDWLEDLAFRLGCEGMRVEARSQQPDMRSYYLKRGYEITGYSERYGIPDIRTHLEKRF
jgi:GNAT superfamily N-acetyltransferase